MRKKVFKKILAFGFLIAMSGCSGNKEASPIVIPPGDAIAYSNSSFIKDSGEYYSMFLNTINPDNFEVYQIDNLTPKQDKSVTQTFNYLIPKDKILEGQSKTGDSGSTTTNPSADPSPAGGYYLITSELSRAGIVLKALVIPGEVVTPSLESTLLFDILSTYPGRSLKKMDQTQIKDLAKLIQSIVLEKLEKYTELSALKMKDKYIFLRNAVGSNLKVLQSLKDNFDIAFSYDSHGLVAEKPFPFGTKNQLPILDASNATPRFAVLNGVEKMDLIVKGKSIDPNGDQLIYRWFLENKYVNSLPNEFHWIPDYDNARAEKYLIQLEVTDGGTPVVFQWQAQIADKDRLPNVKSDCALTIKEGETWSCHITASDFDGDALSFTLNDKFNKARATMNGQKTDDVTRSLTIPNTKEVDLVFVPNNGDAKNRSAFLELAVDDGRSGGVMSVPISLTVQDINSPPVLMLGPTGTPDPNIAAHEWDFCSNIDPDTGGLLPYQFKIEVADPDNQPAAYPRNLVPDKVSVTFGGSLRDLITQFGEADGCPAPTDTLSTFCFSWQAQNNRKTGTLTVQMKDDHGGLADLLSFNLTAEDRNQKPCLSATLFTKVLSELLKPNAVTTFSSQDFDGDTPYLEAYSVPYPLIPFLFVNNETYPIFLQQGVGESEPIYRSKNGASGSGSQAFETKYASVGSGVIVMDRATPYTSDITLPAGFIFETNILGGKRLKYQNLRNLTIAANTLKAVVPVISTDRLVPVGKLHRFISGPPQVDLTVSNPSSLIQGGSVTFNRTNTASALVIPGGTVLGTNEIADGTSTIRYETILSVTMNIGVASISTTVARVNQQALAGEVNVMSSPALPGPAWIATNPLALTEQSTYSLSTYKGTGVNLGSDKFCWLNRAVDGSTVPPGGLHKITTSPDPTLSVTNPSPLELSGNVNFSRTTTTGSLTLPAGTQLQTDNLTYFVTDNAVTLGVGVGTGTTSVHRINDTSPIPPVGSPQIQKACVGFADSNYTPYFISASSVPVNEGGAILDYPILVTDNATDPGDPKDPEDRYTFAAAVVGASPEGASLFCREPGTNAADITIPACTPCTNTNITLFESSVCYLRFKPTINDVSSSFNYQITADDHGASIPAGTNTRTQFLTVNVIEQNDPPSFTDSGWNAIAGNSVGNPSDLGNFVEGVTSSYQVYVTDSDKGLNLKQVGFSLYNQVYDLKTSTWVAAPSGMSIAVTNFVQNPGGWGSKSSARITWNPDDKAAKTLTGPDGFVIRVNAYDSLSNPSTRLTSYGYYKVHVTNINNNPSLISFSSGNVLNISANKYFTYSNIYLKDSDYYALTSPSFTTSLSLCQSTSVFTCPAPLLNWPDELTTYDPNYTGNSSIAQCRTGSVLKTSLALPRLTRLGGFTVSGGVIKYQYKLEWCPQNSHIGNFAALLYLNDNGDKDRNNLTLPSSDATASILLKVTAPVFFESPKMNANYTPAFAMTQTAASMASYPFTYKTRVKNSKGNALDYTILQSPRACAVANGVCINANTGVITWTPKYPDDLTDPNDPLTWKKIEIKVRDKTTNEYDTAYFYLQVQDPLSPLEKAPVLGALTPGSNTVSMLERSHKFFSVDATDPNPNDVLFYRWYLDGVLVYDYSNTYDYFPSYDAGYKPSQHTVKVEVTDGNYTVSNTWTVNVINNVPAPSLVFTLDTKVTGVTNLAWTAEVAAPTTVGANSINYLVMSGNYTRSSLTRNFVWSLQFNNGNINSPNYSGMVRSPWNYFESLPWNAGKVTQRLTIKPTSASAFDIMLSPQTARLGPYSNTTEGVKVSGDLSRFTSLNSSYACTGSCAQSLYSEPATSGSRPTAIFSSTGSNLFYVDDDGQTLLWDKDASNVINFYSLPGNLKVGGLTVNKNTKRLYVSARDVGGQQYRLYIFDLNPVVSNLMPQYVTDLNVFDGVNVDNRLLDVVAVESVNSVYGLLPGTGGVVKLYDDGTGTPIGSDLQFIGVAQVSSSYSEGVGEGNKLILNPTTGILYGLSKDSNQIFTVDTATNAVYAFAADIGFDSVVVFPNDGLVLTINRSAGKVYMVK